MRLKPLVSFITVLCAFIPATGSIGQAIAPAARIVSAIDDSKLAPLKGNTHPFANAKNDRGRVGPTLPMTDLILVLSRDQQQQSAFDKFVASQYDAASPNFHRWLTPVEVGEDFGPASSDIQAITSWLTSHGFSVAQVSNDHMSIRFSGTASQVENAFHTEVHNLEVKGVAHIGNMSDPQIPTALAPAVVGIKSLHNFFAKPLHREGAKVIKDSATGKWKRTNAATEASGRSPRAAVSGVKSQFGVSVPASGGDDAYLVEDVAPYDFATIYNVLPLWNASTAIDGTGQTVAIAGTSSIVMADVTAFRKAFGLPAYTSSNQPSVVSGNSQPVTVCTDSTTLCTLNDQVENALDVEWSGSIAKGATITLVASYPASSSDDGLYDSESYIVNNHTASIMNVSYGECELGIGTAGNVQYYNLWQTAATEGISVFVASGDGGSSECDDGGDASGNPYSAQFGQAVNGLASTPFNTAVGGTDFNWCSLTSTSECTASPYWKSSNDSTTGASAEDYVPEVPWNNTCSSSLALGFIEAQATSASATGVTDAESACSFVYTNSQSSSSLGLEDLIDTIGAGGGASGCVVGDGSTAASCASATTSTGASNGSITLVADGWPKPSWQTGVAGIPTDGVRDLPDVSFFASNGYLSFSAYLICVSAESTDGTCDYSTSDEPLAQEVGGTSVSSPAMAGVMALINQKAGGPQGNPNAELYKLAAAQTYASCKSESSKTSNSCYFNDIDAGTNAMPCDNGAMEGDPAVAGIVSPGCTATHSGDLVGVLPGYSAAAGYDQATGLGSLNVANVVNAWPKDSNGTAAATVTVSPAQTSVATTVALSVPVTVAASTSGGTTPTGTVTLSGGGYTSTAETLASGAYTFSIPASSLTAGSDVLTVTYSGDTTYATTTGASTITVTGASAGSGTATVTVSPAQTTIAASAALTVSVAVAPSTTGGGAPTGTATLSSGSYSSGAGTLLSGAFSFSIPANSLAAGSDVLTVSYSGDTNYAAATGTATVTVTAATSSGTFTLAATSPAGVTAGTAATSTVTVSTSTYVGTATLACALTSSPSGAVDAPTCALSSSTVALSSSSTSGTVTATISSTAATATTTDLRRSHAHPTQARLSEIGRSGRWLGGGAVLSLLIFFGIPARRRRWRAMLGAVLLMAALGSLTACGDFWQSPAGNTADGTTSGAYTFTITGTGAPTVTAVTTTFTFTVN